MEQDFVGTKRWIRPATPYEVYMEEQKLPIHRGTVGFYDIRDLTLGSWKRMGAQGAFIELNGCGGLQGMYVIEVPGAGAITPEKHMYEEIFYVLEGRGTTEIWTGDDATKKQTFEWQLPVTPEGGFQAGEVVTYFCRIHPFMRGAFEVAPA